MRIVPESRRLKTLIELNPWWKAPHRIPVEVEALAPRHYLQRLTSLEATKPILLEGPRGVGKTTLLYQAIGHFIASGIPGTHLIYIPADHPGLAGLSLESLVHSLLAFKKLDFSRGPCYVFIDELAYLPNEPDILTRLAESLPVVKFYAATSVTPKSWFENKKLDLMRLFVNPLSFYEYATYKGIEPEFLDETLVGVNAERANQLNQAFLNYLVLGAFPKVAYSSSEAMGQGYMRKLLTDDLLGRDTSAIFGVGDNRELNQLLTLLVYNSSEETSPDGLSKLTGLAKNTVYKYLTYLEEAHLIRIVYRMKTFGGKLKRQRTFRVFPIHPALRFMLLPLCSEDQPFMPSLMMTSVVGHLLGLGEPVREVRWGGRGVGLAGENASFKPSWALEAGFDDRDHALSELDEMVRFCRIHRLKSLTITTLTRFEGFVHNTVPVTLVPVSFQAYGLGYQVEHGHSLEFAGI